MSYFTRDIHANTSLLARFIFYRVPDKVLFSGEQTISTISPNECTGNDHDVVADSAHRTDQKALKASSWQRNPIVCASFSFRRRSVLRATSLRQALQPKRSSALSVGHSSETGHTNSLFSRIFMIYKNKRE